MREIEFRGKTAICQLATAENCWVYGGIHSIFENDDTCYISVNDYFNKGKSESLLVKKETIGQYTGLKDEKGKKIYEGDIIDFSYDMFVGNFDTFIAKGKIVFEDGAFYVECLENERTIKEESYLLYSINIDTIEVIGSVYDNPELLKDK